MSNIAFGGTYQQALTHFAALGAAAILEDDGYRDLRLQWSEEPTSRLILNVPNADQLEVSAVVREHAIRHTDPQSWVQRIATIDTGKKSVEVGMFSPRIAVPGSARGWQALYEDRRWCLDNPFNSRWLDAIMLQALGEPAFWQVEGKNPRYDEGASRWEMKTRNRGEDFTRNRLALLAQTVSARTPEQILEGLTGLSVSDSKEGPNSRTGTGLVPPGSVDDAVAWCGLWGISAFPIFPRIAGIAVTPGAWPVDRFHTEEMVLPMSTRPLSPSKLRRILRSEVFAVASMKVGQDGLAQADRMVARNQLLSDGVRGLVTLPIRKAGSGTAPERQVLSGTFEPLAD